MVLRGQNLFSRKALHGKKVGGGDGRSKEIIPGNIPLSSEKKSICSRRRKNLRDKKIVFILLDIFLPFLLLLLRPSESQEEWSLWVCLPTTACVCGVCDPLAHLPTVRDIADIKEEREKSEAVWIVGSDRKKKKSQTSLLRAWVGFLSPSSSSSSNLSHQKHLQLAKQKGREPRYQSLIQPILFSPPSTYNRIHCSWNRKSPLPPSFKLISYMYCACLVLNIFPFRRSALSVRACIYTFFTTSAPSYLHIELLFHPGESLSLFLSPCLRISHVKRRKEKQPTMMVKEREKEEEAGYAVPMVVPLYHFWVFFFLLSFSFLRYKTGSFVK